MPSITISAPVYDIDGTVRVAQFTEHDPGAYQRRTTRTATLDGGVVVYDGGFADGDRTVRVSFFPTQEQAETLSRFVREYSSVVVSLADGCFLAVPDLWGYTGGAATLSLLIMSKLSA